MDMIPIWDRVMVANSAIGFWILLLAAFGLTLLVVGYGFNRAQKRKAKLRSLPSPSKDKEKEKDLRKVS